MISITDYEVSYAALVEVTCLSLLFFLLVERGLAFIWPGARITATLPGIAKDFRIEVIELHQENDQTSRVYAKALESVLGYGSGIVLYEQGSRLWLKMTTREGYFFDETSENSEIPPVVRLLDDGLGSAE